ncbi:MAG TPA: hypothetical protein VNA17_01955 [Pyrinomonadaceae bacterium]|nr:hypothetical protein [Pyrinomonadaceae bacterium]
MGARAHGVVGLKLSYPALPPTPTEKPAKKVGHELMRGCPFEFRASAAESFSDRDYL